MYPSIVFIPVVRAGEALGAGYFKAGERPISCVHPPVSLQGVSSRKAHFAVLASVLLLHRDSY